MIPTDKKHAFVQELARIFENPSLEGKFITVSTFMRMIEDRHGVGFCEGTDEDELLELINEASGIDASTQ